MNITGGTVLQLLFSAGVTTVVVTVINGFLQRRKMGADTTKIITDAASGVVARIESDNDRLRTEAVTHRTREDSLDSRIDALEAHIERLVEERFAWVKLLRAHSDWDDTVVAQIRKALPGIAIPDPPPLIPPALLPRHPKDE